MTTSAPVTKQIVAIDVADGTKMVLHVTRPHDVSANTPGAFVVQDAFGMTGFLDDVASRVAEAGFVAVSPELYHRTGDGVVISYDDREMTANRPHMQGMKPEGVLADMSAAFSWLTTAGGVAPGNVVSLGFCMGGTTSYLANAHLPLRAAVSFYGNIRPERLEAAARQHGPILMFWGDLDQSIPKEKHRAVADALGAGGARHAQVVFSDADHGFFCHPRPWCYNENASRQAWAMTMEFFRTEGLEMIP